MDQGVQGDQGLAGDTGSGEVMYYAEMILVATTKDVLSRRWTERIRMYW